jgi:hypothetical protein
MSIFKANRFLALFMAILLIVGGFIGQSIGATTSTAYDVFHVIFGVIALIAVLYQGGKYSYAFNLLFGAIDLYQVAAFGLGIFPAQLFALTVSDNIQHIVLAAVLLIVGYLGLRHAQAQAA